MSTEAEAPPELFRTIDPESVGQLPSDIFAIQQVGKFVGVACAQHKPAAVVGCADCTQGTDGHTKTVIELTHSKARVDRAAQYVLAYGSPEHKYKVYYGRIVWESEGDVVPEAAPVQQLFDPGVRMVKGRAYVGELPAKGTPGKVKAAKKPKTVEVGE